MFWLLLMLTAPILTVDETTQILSWTWPSSVQVDYLTMNYRNDPTRLTMTPLNPASLSISIRAVVTSGGPWNCELVAADSQGNSPLSNNVSFRASSVVPPIAPNNLTVKRPMILGLFLSVAASVGNPFCNGFNLQATSPAIDAGTIIEGFHCPAAGSALDQPRLSDGSNCHEWYGAAPDIGACEYVPPSSTVSPPGQPATLKVNQ
jgi:hypothetical protein